jgi:hypothetical protein
MRRMVVQRPDTHGAGKSYAEGRRLIRAAYPRVARPNPAARIRFVSARGERYNRTLNRQDASPNPAERIRFGPVRGGRYNRTLNRQDD